MKRVAVTKVFTFDYAHHLPGYDGKCANLHGHGATLEVEVIKTNAIKSTYEGMVMDFSDLKEIVTRKVLVHMDHTCINYFIQFPTAENMVLWIVKQLEEELGTSVQRVRLYETPDSYAEWKR